MRAVRSSLFVALSWGLAGGALAHGGGLDKNGCHHDRKNGGYHCHRAPPLQVAEPIRQDPPAAPRCFTGPRGGTYTITSSGRKNYGGC